MSQRLFFFAAEWHSRDRSEPHVVVRLDPRAVRNAAAGELSLNAIQRREIRNADENDVGNAVEVVFGRRDGQSRMIGLHHLMFKGNVLADEEVNVSLGG